MSGTSTGAALRAFAALMAGLLTALEPAGAASGTVRPDAGGAASSPQVRAMSATPLDLNCSQELNIQWPYYSALGNLSLDIYAGNGAFSFSISNTTASAQGTAHAYAAIRMSSISGGTADHSGTMKLSLWAISPNRAIGAGSMNGHLLGSFRPSIVNADGTTRDYLYNNSAVSVSGDFSVTNPPAGRYCLALALDSYAKSPPVCGSRAVDGFCLTSFIVFPKTFTFN